MKKKRAAVLIAAAVLGLSLLAGCGQKQEEESSDSSAKPVVVQQESAELVQTESAEPAVSSNASYLTGEPISSDYQNKRPMAIMIPNDDYGALPQYNISKAGVIYEAPVEGGYTRLMAIFDRADYENLDKIGPVRSCRLYYPQFALEFDAMYCHIGQAVYAEDFLNSGEVDDINGLTTDGVYFRDSSDGRKAPNNAFTSGELLLSQIQAKGFDENYSDSYTGHFTFADEDTTPENGQDAQTVSLPYPVNTPYFTYNSDDGMYYRFQYGDKQVDAAISDTDHNQLAVKNILIQSCPCRDIDEKTYKEIDTTAGGDGWYITNGKAEKVTWSKADLHSPAKYFDENGNEIQVNKGKTWVCIVGNDDFGNVSITGAQSEAQ